MENDFRILIEAILDNTSLSKVKEQISKTKIDIKPDLSVENFAKSKQEIQKHFNDIANSVQKATQVDDKQAVKWANEYYNAIISGAKQAAKEQENLNKLQQKAVDDKQNSYYSQIADNYRKIYSLKEKLLSADKQETAEIEKQIRSLNSSNAGIYGQLKRKGLSNTGLESEAKATEDILKNRLAISQARANDKSIAQEVANIERSSNELQKQKDAFNKKNINGIDLEIAKREKESRRFAELLKSQMQSTANMQYDIDTKSYDVKFAQIQAGFRKTGEEATITSNRLTEARETYQSFIDAVNSGNIETAASKQALLDQQIKTLQADLSIAALEASEFVTPLQAVKLSNKIQSWLKNNTAATKEARLTMRQYLQEIEASNGKLAKVDYQRISAGYDSQNTLMRQMGKLGNSTLATLKQGMSKFTRWIGASAIVMKTINETRKGIQTIAELDDGLTNINYTMEVTSSQLKDIGNSSVKAAKDLHTSVSTVMDAVKTYANATETAETIIEKAKPTIMMSNVSGMGVESTVDILQGTMEQFDLAEDKLMHISDVMQAVSASMPYDFSKGIRELSEGIQASGSVAKDSGYELENYTALLGTLIAKTRQSGSELGRSLRTMFVRTTKASSSALASGEVTEEDLSNAEAALGRVGIQVRSDLDTFRSFDEIMGDLYEKVDSLSEVDLSNIAYEVASTRQTNVFKMMIKAYGEYQGMAEKAAKADGITLANQEKYAKSVKGHLGELKSTGESIWNNVLNSGELKAGVDTLTVLLKLLDGITGKLHGMGTIGLGLGAFLGVKNAGMVQSVSSKRNCFKYAPHAQDVKSRVGVCWISHPTAFYKINRNWELPSPSAGKTREYIVTTHYNVTGNGMRECTPKWMSVMARKAVVSHMVKA